MHFYPFHVSDYIHDTAHLSNDEDLAFRRLLDLYYTQEKPIPNKTHEVARRIRMTTNVDAVQIVLNEFFTHDTENDCWFHKRCDETISAYKAKAERNREVGKLGGRPKTNPDANPKETQTVSKSNPNQEPITNNHKPVIEKKHRGTRLPTELEMPKEYADFCKQERPDLNPQKTFDGFKDYWVSKAGAAGVKLDWLATWRNWVRNQRQERPNSADIVRMTVPSKVDRDPVLVALETSRASSKPPTPEIMEKLKQARLIK